MIILIGGEDHPQDRMGFDQKKDRLFQAFRIHVLRKLSEERKIVGRAFRMPLAFHENRSLFLGQKKFFHM